jgi:hypothetical protein
MRCKLFIIILACIIAPWSVRTGLVLAEDQPVKGPSLRLVRAVMCETIDEYEPRNIAVTFSINIGRISCYTSFDEVADVTQVEHRWYRREELVTAKRLTLKPPSWATYSSIQLREADKGPWRVEIWQVDGPLMKTIRFSVTD